MTIQIVTTLSLVMERLLNLAVASYPNSFKYYYEPNLDPVSILKTVKADEKAKAGSPVTTKLPMLLFNRKSLKGNEIFGEHVRKSYYGIHDNSNNVKQFKGGIATLEMEFKYVANKMDSIEAFEVLYTLSSAIKSIKQFELDLGTELGRFPYQVDWDDLSDADLVKEDVTLFMVGATFRIHGPILVFINTLPAIADIVTRTNLFYKNVGLSSLISTTHIVP